MAPGKNTDDWTGGSAPKVLKDQIAAAQAQVLATTLAKLQAQISEVRALLGEISPVVVEIRRESDN